MPRLLSAHPADRLGELRAELKRITERVKAAEAGIKDMLPEGGTLVGDFYRVTVSHSKRKTVNWKKIATDLEASPARIRGNTKTSEVTRVDCRAHVKAAA